MANTSLEILYEIQKKHEDIFIVNEEYAELRLKKYEQYGIAKIRSEFSYIAVAPNLCSFYYRTRSKEKPRYTIVIAGDSGDPLMFWSEYNKYEFEDKKQIMNNIEKLVIQYKKIMNDFKLYDMEEDFDD